MRWKTRPLASIARIGAGQGAPQRVDEFDSEGQPFVRAGSLESLCAGAGEDLLEKIPDSVAKMRRMTLHPPGTIVFAKSGMSATLGRVYKLTKPSYIVNHLATINAEAGVDATFLTQFFRFSPPSRLIKDKAYPSIRLSDISAWEIPLPPLDEQRRIAAVLDKADALRRLRLLSIHLTEKLLQSVFLDLFGDPKANPKGWDHCSLEDLCERIVDCPHSTPIYSESPTGFYCVRSSDIQNGKLDLESTKHVSEVVFAERIARYEPRVGEVIYTREGGRLGHAAQVTKGKRICLGQRMMLFSGKANVASNAFLNGLLNSDSFRGQVLKLVGGGCSKSEHQRPKNNWSLSTAHRNTITL
jgi:restriction endonuclease S subunit